MTTLHDRLADLADEAPTSLPAPGLWDRGRRYHRRRRAGTLAIVAAALVVLVLLGGVSWQRSAPEPAPAAGHVGLPDRVWTPSPWLPNTDAPGRLIAVTTSDRGSWKGMHPGVVGISATTGEYAFLDLPDAELDHLDTAAVSPDGRRVAYWITGETTGTPNSASGPVTGVAVFDADTGGVSRHWIRTAHGVYLDFLAWADPETVVFSAGQIRGGDDASDMAQSSGRVGRVMSWSPGSEPEPVPGVAPGASLIGASHGRIVVDTGSSEPGRTYRLIDLTSPSRGRFLGIPGISGSVNGLPFVALDASGRRIALVPGHRNPNRVRAGLVGDLHEVPNSRATWGVLDWLDARTIVTLRRTGNPPEEGSGLFRVSVSSGESRELVRFVADSFGGGWQFATDLLDAPSVHAEQPPSPMDPRWTAGLAAGAVLAAGVALVLWRRRVRP